jgi:RNA recognition motif-containing protein
MQNEHQIDGKIVDVNIAIPKENSKHIKNELYRRKIYIPDLDFEITEKKLKAYFEKLGEVKKVYIVEDTIHQGKNKSIGYVEFADANSREEVFNSGVVHKIGKSELNCKRYCPMGWNPNSNDKTTKRRREQLREVKRARKSSPKNFTEYCEFVQEKAKFQDQKLKGKNRNYGRRNLEGKFKGKNFLKNIRKNQRVRFPIFKEMKKSKRVNYMLRKHSGSNLWSGEEMLHIEHEGYRFRIPLKNYIKK